jgi:hypothetical protein
MVYVKTEPKSFSVLSVVDTTDSTAVIVSVEGLLTLS